MKRDRSSREIIERRQERGRKAVAMDEADEESGRRKAEERIEEGEDGGRR